MSKVAGSEMIYDIIQSQQTSQVFRRIRPESHPTQ